MTVDQLRSLLSNIHTALEFGKEHYPVDLNRSLMDVVRQLDENSVRMLASLFNLKGSDLLENRDKMVKIMSSVDTLFTSNQYKEISNMCRELMNRPVILQMIASLF